MLGFEALVRGPRDSPLETPFALFGAAQREGSLVELNIVCIQETLRAYARARLPGLLFLNISPQLIVQPGFDQARAARFLAGLGLEAAQVVIELTEDYPSFDFGAVRESLQLYRAMGFRVALDDLGEGSSTLRLWSELRPEFVKADKHFVTGVAGDVVKVQFLRAIQHIAEGSGSRVIAEGIEAEADFRLVKDLGIACGQGWFIGMPQRAPQAELPAAADAAQRDARVSVPQARAVLAGKTARDLVRDGVGTGATPPSLCVNAGLDLDALAAALAEADDATLAEGFGVVESGRLVGRGRTQDVIRALQGARVEAARHTQPLTQLPGSVPVHEHLDRLLARRVPFCAWLAEIDEMTGLNDAEGFGCGDRLIHATARLIESACEPGIDFAGHLGGTRFAALLQGPDWRERAQHIVRAFPRVLESQTSAETFARGYFRVVDREGAPGVRPLPRLVLGVLPVLPGLFASRHEVLAAAKAASQRAARGAASALHVDELRANAYPPSLLLEAR